MSYLLLACEIEYKQAAKRLEEIAQAKPGTIEAAERRKLLKLIIQFEKETNQLYQHKPKKTSDSCTI